MNVGELRKQLNGLSDEMPVHVGVEEGGEIILRNIALVRQAASHTLRSGDVCVIELLPNEQQQARPESRIAT